MAQFDLKKARVYFVDGHSNTGAVNNVAGYTSGSTTMLVDTITGVIPTYATFTVTGETNPNVYTVTAHSETLGNTTSITFSPGLYEAVTDGDVLVFGGRRLYVKIGEGNLTWSEKRNMEYKLDRGALDTVREGDQVPLELKFDFQWEFLKAGVSTDPPTPMEVIKKIGNASAWTTSSSDPCEPYAIDVLMVYEPDCSGVKAETILFKDYRWESCDQDSKAGTISTSGKCNVTQAEIARLTLGA